MGSRAPWLVLCTLIAAPHVARTQTRPAFEVASVKPTQHVRNAEGWSYSSIDIPSPGRLVASNSSLDECIRFAYDVKEYQISGPAWLNDDSESFDIEAKAPAGTVKRSDVRLMLQALLAERFGLALHRETMILPAYELVEAKGGAKLVKADPEGQGSTASGGGKMTATHASMADFAYQLSRHLDRPVFDKTGIEGTFDIALEYASDDREGSDRPAFFVALERQAGLRLNAVKAPVEVVVIDHIDKAPSGN